MFRITRQASSQLNVLPKRVSEWALDENFSHFSRKKIGVLQESHILSIILAHVRRAIIGGGIYLEKIYAHEPINTVVKVHLAV